MPKKNESESSAALGGVLAHMSAGELQELARTIAQIAAAAREEGQGRELHPSAAFGPKEPAVQQLATIQLRTLLTPKRDGGEGMSLRDVASMLDVSYERVRGLAKKLLPEYSDIAEEKRRVKS